MWAYWDHPHTRAPGCPLITSRGQPLSFLLLQVTFFLVFTRISIKRLNGKKYTSSARYRIVVASLNQYSLSALLSVPFFHILYLKHLFLLTSFPQKTKSLNIASVSLWANPSPLRYLWVCPYSRLQLFFQAALFHLNFNPIYGLSFSPRLPGAIKLFIQRTSCHPALS